MFEAGQRITVPNPDNPGGRLAATFLEVAVGRPATIAGRKVDQAWVRYEEGDRDGITGLVPWPDLHRSR